MSIKAVVPSHFDTGVEKPPIALLGITFDNVNLTEALSRIGTMIAEREPRYIVTANVDFLVQARQDVELRRILLDAHLVLCDGTPLVWMSRLLGNPLPERVAGSDLVPKLIRIAAEENHRLFFLGATPEANAQAVANVRRQFPNVIVDGYSPPFRPLAEMNNEEIARRISAAKPDVLFVSFGCPKAEKWMAANYHSLGVPVVIGIGGTIDLLAGRVKRAPLWMQRAGVEWLFRLCQEPRRLYRRYVTDLWQFGLAITSQLWRMKICLHRSHAKESCSLVASEPKCKHIHVPERFDAEVVRHDLAILENAAQCDCLLDLSDTDFIDSTGVGELLQLRKRMRSAGCRLVLVSPNRAVRQTLELMRVGRFFLMARDISEARRLISERMREFNTAYLLDLGGLASRPMA